MENVCLILYNCFTVTQMRQVFGSWVRVMLDSCFLWQPKEPPQACPREIQAVLDYILRVIFKALIRGVIFGGTAKEQGLCASADVSVWVCTCTHAWLLVFCNTETFVAIISWYLWTHLCVGCDCWCMEPGWFMLDFMDSGMSNAILIYR